VSGRKPPKRGEKGYERVEFDNYRTPPWVTNVLLDHVTVPRHVWEPAAGDLDMVKALRGRGHVVYASDIRVLPGLDRAPCDFAGGVDWSLPLMRGEIPKPPAVITNPPYMQGVLRAFVERALAVTEETRGMVAMLLPYESDAPKIRRDLFQHPAFHAKIVLPHRITWIGLERGADGRKKGPRQIHAWYVWRWDVPNAGGGRIIYT
jgi:hypothetical protein